MQHRNKIRMELVKEQFHFVFKNDIQNRRYEMYYRETFKSKLIKLLIQFIKWLKQWKRKS